MSGKEANGVDWRRAAMMALGASRSGEERRGASRRGGAHNVLNRAWRRADVRELRSSGVTSTEGHSARATCTPRERATPNVIHSQHTQQ